MESMTSVNQENQDNSHQAEKEVIQPANIEMEQTGPAETISPQVGGSDCPSCNSEQSLMSEMMQEVAYVYALGNIEARFPSAAVEKEFAQAVGRLDTKGETDQKAFYSALSQRENRYLARKICWVFNIQGLDTYILMPHDSSDLDLIIESIRPAPSPLDVDVVIGQRGPFAPADLCNGLVVPIVKLDQVYSFDSQSLIKSIPRPSKIKQEDFAPIAEEVFHRVMQMADNAGATDEHRALNYLAMRYPAIYANTTECYQREMSLTDVDVRQSRLSGARKIMDVIFSYTNRKTDVVEKYYVRVDSTEEFPFLVNKISPYVEI